MDQATKDFIKSIGYKPSDFQSWMTLDQVKQSISDTLGPDWQNKQLTDYYNPNSVTTAKGSNPQIEAQAKLVSQAYENWRTANAGKLNANYTTADEKKYLGLIGVNNLPQWDYEKTHAAQIDQYGNIIGTQNIGAEGAASAIAAINSGAFNTNPTGLGTDRVPNPFGLRAIGTTASGQRFDPYPQKDISGGIVATINGQSMTQAQADAFFAAHPSGGSSAQTTTSITPPATTTAASATPSAWTTPVSAPQMFNSQDDIFRKSIGGGKSNLGGLLGNTSPYDSNNPFSGKK